MTVPYTIFLHNKTYHNKLDDRSRTGVLMSNFSVEVRTDEPFEKALRRFTSKTRRAGLLRDLKKRRFYTKPSVQKKIDKQKSIRRQQKALRMAATGQTRGSTTGGRGRS